MVVNAALAILGHYYSLLYPPRIYSYEAIQLNLATTRPECIRTVMTTISLILIHE
jgi:hypothetical protein